MSIKRTTFVNSDGITDVFGNKIFGNNSATSYASNAGDVTSYKVTFTENIYFISGAPFGNITSNVNLTALKKLRFPTYVSMNGFEVGQNVTLIKTKPNGTTTTKVTTIVSIDFDALLIEFASLFTPANENIYTYDDTTTLQVYSTDLRKDLDVYFNIATAVQSPFDFQVISQNQGSYFTQSDNYRKSVIDGSYVRFNYPTTDAITVGSTVILSSVGFPSGYFEATVKLKRNADVNAYTRSWELEIINSQFGILTPNIFVGAVHFYYSLDWFSNLTKENPTSVQSKIFGLQDDFDSPYTLGLPLSTLTSQASDLYYDSEVINTTTIESASPQITLGGAYIPKDETYYKSRPYTQNELCMQIFGTAGLPLGVYTSGINPDGAQVQIEILAYSYIGTTHTIQWSFKNVNTQFVDFIESKPVDDRVYYVWFQIGAVPPATSGNTAMNILVWKDQLLKTPKPLIALTDYEPNPTDNYIKIITDKVSDFYPLVGTGAVVGFNSSKEDNFTLTAQLLVPKFKRYENANYKLVVANRSNPEDFFILEEANFDLDSQTYNETTGITEFNLEQLNSYNLQNQTAGKRSRIVRQSVYSDTLTKFATTLVFGFQVNWRYWIQQLNAFSQFYPNQNKDFINYSDLDYGIFARIEFENEDTIANFETELVDIYDYNEAFSTASEEWAGTSSIKYFDSTGAQVTNLIIGEVMTLEVTVNTGITALANSYWGQLTIERTENSPRWMLSSNYSFDNNINNPLFPIAGQTRLLRTLVTPNQVTYTAQIDCTKLTGEAQKITLKHFNNNGKIEQTRIKFDTKLLPPKVLSPFSEDESLECCDNFKVFGSTGSGDPSKSDVTSRWQLLEVGASVTFELYKDGVLSVVQPTVATFVNQSNAKYCTVFWKQVLITDGVGCYELKQTYTDSALIVTETSYGTFELKEWSEDAVSGLVQVKACFNSVQNSYGIDFTNSFVYDCLNFQGFFGERDTKTEIDNAIYSSRLQVSVVRENLNEYSLTSNPLTKKFTRILLDLYFLSENDLYITDNNSFNHEDYTYKRVICSSVESPEYFQYSKFAVVKAKFMDKVLNQKTNY